MKVKNLSYGRNTFSQIYNVCARRCSQDCWPIRKSTKKSLWGHVKKAAPDPTLSVNQLFLEDKHCQKVNLSMGVYSVLEAEKIIKEKYNDKEYSSQAGVVNYNSLALKLLLGDDSVALCQKRTATVQALGGTGAVHIAVQFLNKHFPGNKKVYLSKPTCPQIPSICQTANLDIEWYRYYCRNTRELDFKGFLEDVFTMTPRSIIYLQCCGHDPTGADLSQEQWCELSEVVTKKKLYPLFDVSNQGLVTGNTDDDTFAIRLFAEQGHSFTAVQSFSRNMGIYSMFCFTNMTEEQIKKIAAEYHVYMTIDGRISIPGLNTKNVDYVAKAIHQVTKFLLEPFKRLVFNIQTRNCSHECSDSPRWWIHLERAPADPILGIIKFFNADKSPNKVNLIAGVYRDDKGKPVILNCVREAEKRIAKKYNDKEYAPISGIPEFNRLSAEVLFGAGSEVICNELNATIQTISGTGALYVSGKFLAQFFPGNKHIFLPKPTWANHEAIFSFVGLKIGWYRYYDYKTAALDFHGLMEDISKIPEKSIAFFHGCAHNPTGVDPNQEQWCEISQVVKERQLFALFDIAYQGFASGERTGSCTFVADCKAEAEIIVTQLDQIARKTYTSPPIHGARIALEILQDEKLKQMWLEEVKVMAER
nr:unnamed protein product [Callosobruchus analis]